MVKVLLSRRSIVERWDFESTSVIEKYEKQGMITRVPKIPYPRYSIRQIEKIENVEDINALSPYERKRLEGKILELEKELDIYKSKLEKIKLEVL